MLQRINIILHYINSAYLGGGGVTVEIDTSNKTFVNRREAVTLPNRHYLSYYTKYLYFKENLTDDANSTANLN